MKSDETSFLKRGLWIFAITANAAMLAWFGDLLHATDTRTKLQTATATVIVQSTALNGHDIPTLDAIAHRAGLAIKKFAAQSAYEFLNQAQVEITSEASLPG